MEHFLGEVVRSGSALASAAKVRQKFGLASISSARIDRVSLLLERDPDVPVETEDIILVARSVPAGLLHNTIAGYNVVGLAIAEYPDDDFEPGVPCICGLGESFFAAVAENDLLLLDAHSGSVYIQPDASLVSRFQAPVRAYRYFLDDAHLPAKTASDNRVIAVYGHMAAPDDLAIGLANGADGICIAGASLLNGETGVATSKHQRQALEGIVKETAGLPLLIDVPFEDVSIAALLEISASTTLELILDSLAAINDARGEIAMAQLMSPHTGLNGGIGLHVAIDPEADVPDADALENIAGLAFREATAGFSGTVLLPLLSYAHRAGLPATVYLPETDWEQDLEDAVRFGIPRIVAHPATILSVKDAIREL